MLQKELVTGHLVVDQNGRHGVNGMRGFDGRHGQFGGGHGGDGTLGQNGEFGINAESIDLSFQSDNNFGFFDGVDSLKPKAFQFGDKEVEISLLSVGGNGGAGGDGGEGGRGGDGIPGRDATRYSSGSNGGPGGDGGNGANGGMGGDGGIGGIIYVKAFEKDLDMFMLVKGVQYKGGLLGRAGLGGSGGAGGMGGRGGSSYSWTEYDNHHNTSRTYTNPGGFSGPPGRRGLDGQNGLPGMLGKDGEFCFIISETGARFNQRYELSIAYTAPILSDDGIIEPGEILQQGYILYRNIGPMHTPIYQHIRLYLEENRWVQFDQNNSHFITQSLLPQQEWSIQKPMTFKINDYNGVTEDATFKSTATIDYRAQLMRIDKEFHSVKNFNDNYEIRFPVEISLVNVAKSITIKEEAPLVVAIFNRSQKVVGITSEASRLLRVRIEHTEGTRAIQFTRVQNNFDQYYLDDGRTQTEEHFSHFPVHQASQPTEEDLSLPKFSQEVLRIMPGQTLYVTGTMKFTDADLPAYTKSKMSFNLDLGNIHFPTQSYQHIQKRNFEIQLAESFEYSENADYLLVVNCDSTKQQIDAFKNFALQIGTQCLVWNISNYGGFSFNYIPGTCDVPFHQLLKDKVVVIFDNSYDDHQNLMHNATRDMGDMQLYEAARKYDITCLVIGPNENFNLLKNMLPFYNILEEEVTYNNFEAYKLKMNQLSEQQKNFFVNQEELYPQIAITSNIMKYGMCSELNKQDLQLAAEALSKKLRDQFPHQQNLLIITNNVKKIEEGCASKVYDLGSISIRRGLDLTKAKLAQRFKTNEQIKQVDQVDLYAMVKLMSFKKKYLRLRNAINRPEIRPIFTKAIIADLIDECMTFINNSQNPLKPQLYEKVMTSWNYFQQFEYNFLTDDDWAADNNTFRTEFGQALIVLRLVLQKIPSFTDKFCCFCCRSSYTVSKICIGKLDFVYKKFFTLPQVQESNFKLITSKKLDQLKKPDLIKYVQNPEPQLVPNSQVFYNNQIATSLVVENTKLPNLSDALGVIAEQQYKFRDSLANISLTELKNQKINEFISQIKFDG